MIQCKHDWVGDDNCVYCRNDELEAENIRLREALNERSDQLVEALRSQADTGEKQ